MFNLIKYLYSLPIKKYTIKKFENNKLSNKNKIKLTKKLIY